MSDFKALVLARKDAVLKFEQANTYCFDLYKLHHALIRDLNENSSEAEVQRLLDLEVEIANAKHLAAMAKIRLKSAEVDRDEFIDQEVERRECQKQNSPQKS